MTSIVKLDLNTGQFETLRRSNDLETYPQYFSVPRAIEFPTEGGLIAHGFFYPPQNPDYRAPENEKPPLIVKSHGGPTAAASTALSLVSSVLDQQGIRGARRQLRRKHRLRAPVS